MSAIENIKEALKCNNGNCPYCAYKDKVLNEALALLEAEPKEPYQPDLAAEVQEFISIIPKDNTHFITGTAKDLLERLLAENETMEKQIEQLRVQLAGCGVAALGGAKGENDCKIGGYGYSASFQDVKDLYAKYENLLAENAELRRANSQQTDMLNGRLKGDSNEAI
jgi:cell division protein FtsB